MQQQGDRHPIADQPANGEAALAHFVFAGRDSRRPEASEISDGNVSASEEGIMQPCDRLTPKEIRVAVLVWEGLTNREIAKILGTTEQVIKNYLRNTFDKLGVWSRLELALYVANHGGASWKEPLEPVPASGAVPQLQVAG
jgi:DNA-binding NarL/FixJ family response regulator